MSAAVLVMDSPIGVLGLVGDDDALVAIEFLEGSSRLNRVARLAPSPLQETHRQLTAYFDHDLEVFDLPLVPVGTPFQVRVWTELLRIPFGLTATYGDVAVRLGLTGAASRAIGAAAGSNPLPVVVPCHRVIGADGTLVGYSGGVWRKEVLLRHEGSWSPSEQLALFAEPS